MPLLLYIPFTNQKLWYKKNTGFIHEPRIPLHAQNNVCTTIITYGKTNTIKPIPTNIYTKNRDYCYIIN